MPPRNSLTGSPPSPPLAPTADQFWLRWLGLALLCAVAYFPAIHGGFLWDDNMHVTAPELRTLGGLARIWFEPGATQQYYPVLHSAFWLEHGLWGDSAAAYHWLNILLHATAAGLLVRLLQRLAVPGAWLAGLVFALHPVGVESVAWISEQKNTLSAVFYLLAAMAWLRFDEQRAHANGGPASAGWRGYAFATLFFILAILTKSVTATLPAALLVLAWWQRGALTWRRDIAPLLPWFALGLAAGLCTAWVERRFVGAEGAAYALDPLQRVLLAGRVPWFYLGKLLWPAGLSFVYPRWTIDVSAAWQYAFGLAALAVLAVGWSLRGRTRAPLAGTLFFCGTLFPALGFFNVYPFIYSYVADHFQYLACLGVIVPVSAWLALTLASLPAWVRRGVPAALVAILGFLTWQQAHDYRDNVTLYRATLARNPAAWMAAYNLGMELAARNETDAALASYREALRLRPDYAEAHGNLAMSLLTLPDRKDEAVAHLETAVRLKPDLWQAENNLANTLAAMPGREEDAIRHYLAVLRRRPELAEIQMNLGIALLGRNRQAEAIPHLESAVRTNPDLWQAHYVLAHELLTLPGRRAEVILHLEAVLRVNPGFAPARELLEQLK
jgi:tetratricopeptide (TPR) repeat protein